MVKLSYDNIDLFDTLATALSEVTSLMCVRATVRLLINITSFHHENYISLVSDYMLLFLWSLWDDNMVYTFIIEVSYC